MQEYKINRFVSSLFFQYFAACLAINFGTKFTSLKIIVMPFLAFNIRILVDTVEHKRRSLLSIFNSSFSKRKTSCTCTCKQKTGKLSLTVLVKTKIINAKKR